MSFLIYVLLYFFLYLYIFIIIYLSLFPKSNLNQDLSPAILLTFYSPFLGLKKGSFPLEAQVS